MAWTMKMEAFHPQPPQGEEYDAMSGSGWGKSTKNEYGPHHENAS